MRSMNHTGRTGTARGLFLGAVLGAVVGYFAGRAAGNPAMGIILGSLVGAALLYRVNPGQPEPALNPAWTAPAAIAGGSSRVAVPGQLAAR